MVKIFQKFKGTSVFKEIVEHQVNDDEDKIYNTVFKALVEHHVNEEQGKMCNAAKKEKVEGQLQGILKQFE